uniref:DUF4283 domain-containing protein n=1 Tax=Cannabis sativa TaxID=3483 RepID=A0A803PHQ0_CANSA
MYNPITNRTSQDVSIGKNPSPPILRSNIVHNLESRFGSSKSKNEEDIQSSKSKVKIDFADIAEEVNYWQPSLICYVIGANPPISILEGLLDAYGMIQWLKKPMVMKRWNSIDDFIFTKEEVINVPTWIQLKAMIKVDQDHASWLQLSIGGTCSSGGAEPTPRRRGSGSGSEPGGLMIELDLLPGGSSTTRRQEEAANRSISPPTTAGTRYRRCPRTQLRFQSC